MKIAVIGGGISGIAAAHRLQDQAEVTLFETARRLGGHTDTHAILCGGRTYRVDSGFIVFNEQNYPRFSAWLAELGVATRVSDMSFGVTNRLTGVEYGTAGLNALFCQRRNIGSPRFLRMLKDLRRFYREACAIRADDPRTLAGYLHERGYSEGFAENHLLPMCAALWSVPLQTAARVPVAHVVAFMAHHRMLQLCGRPQWRVVDGGSGSYLRAFADSFHGRIRLGEPVLQVARAVDHAVVTTRTGRHRFDRVVIACHSDQALTLLEDPSPAERAILGAIAYQRNLAVVHSDNSVMPAARAAWSSWNTVVDDQRNQACRVTYWMNRLQSLDYDQHFFVTLNPPEELRSVWSVREYDHPVFDADARRAQARRHEISGVRNTGYCGAYWGWGFHEDGFASGCDVAVAMCEARAHAA